MIKKLLFLLLPLLTFGQSRMDYTRVNTVTQVGDTLVVKFQYFKGDNSNDAVLYQFDLQYNNKLLTPVNRVWQPQSTSAQKAYNSWNGYKFTADSNTGQTDFDGQYLSWLAGNASYSTNADWGVERVTYQDVTALETGAEIIKYYFLIKDKFNTNYSDYSNIINVNWANYKDSSNGQIDVTGQSSLSLSGIQGGNAGDVTLSLYTNVISNNIGDGTDFIYKVYYKSEIGEGNQPNADATVVAEGAYDVSGQATVSGLVNDVEYFVWNYIDQSKDYMDNVVTVSDLALIFKEAIGAGSSPNGNSTTFDYYIQTFLGNIYHDSAFDGNIDFTDSYEVLAYLQGLTSTRTVYISKKGAGYNSGGNKSTFGTVDDNGSYLAKIDATFKPTDSNKSFDFVHVLIGDVNFSHSWEPDTEGTSIPTSTSARASLVQGAKYDAEEATLDLVSELKDGKVVFTINSEVEGMIGSQFNIIYDNTRLDLDDVIFDTGNTMTNFSNHNRELGKVNIGSFDQNFSTTVKTGKPYQLIFTPLIELDNTSGLITFKVNEGVKADGTQIIFKLN